MTTITNQTATITAIEQILFDNLVKSTCILYQLQNGHETVKQIIDRIFESVKTQLANEKVI